MKNRTFLILVHSLFLLAFSFSAAACMTFVVGRKASKTGYVIVGHNEDDWPPCTAFHALVPARDWPAGSHLPATAGCNPHVPQVAHTLACYWGEVKFPYGDGNADTFLNERGVFIVSDSGGHSTEPMDDPSLLTEGGVKFNLRRAVGERAQNARDGVRILGELVEKYGYAPSARIYTVADRDEAWLVQVVHGRNFVAVRCPDDEVTIMPNLYTVYALDAWPKGDVIASKDLVANARRKGYWDGTGAFNFARAYQGSYDYGPNHAFEHPNNTGRFRQAIRLLTGASWPEGKPFPFSVRPSRGTLSADDLKAVLTAHNAPLRDGRHDLKTWSICSSTTIESEICVFAATPRDTEMRVALGRGCEKPYLRFRPFREGLPAEMDDSASADERLRTHVERMGAMPAAALRRVAARRAAGELPADRVAEIRLPAGTYELDDVLRLEGVRHVRFVGDGAEKTILSGGRRLGPFTAGADGLWRAKAPAGLVFEQLWVNGRRAQLAREPNRFYHYVLEASGEAVDPRTGREADLGRRRFRTDPKALACLRGLSAEELARVSVRVWWAWDAEWGKPVAVEPETGWITLRADVGRNFYMWPKWCPRVTIENCRGALDAPGEWFLDRKAGEVLYVPRPGERPETTHAVAPALGKILDVSGSEDVAFEGIGFAHNGWCVPERGFYARQSAFKADAALDVRDSGRVAFRNCRVTATANYGIWFGEGAHDSAVRHSWFEDLGAGGVRLGACAWTTNTPPEKVTQRVTVDDNVITSGGHVFAAGTGVFVTFAKDCRVTHNEICDLYYSGICCGWRWGYAPAPNRDNTLAWNHIHHLGKGVLSDMGFIYTLGDSRGTVVAGNHGHDMFSYGYTGSGGTGLYPDEGSRGILWTSNLIHHTKTSALSQHYGRENLFRNNIFAFSTKPESSVAGRWRVENHTSLIVSNNIFAWDAGHRAWRGPGGKPGPVHDLVFGSNLWWGRDGVGTNDFNRGTWEKWRADGMDAGSLLGDPLFRDWRNGDWRLKPESPAFRIGFREWDYTEAGVRKNDAAWRAKAAAIRPAAYDVAPVPPANPGQRHFRTGFETRKPGHFPNGAFAAPGVGRKFGYVMESTRAHRHGAQALEIRDFKGLATRYWPHFHQRFVISGEAFRLAFSLKCDAKADLQCEWREWTQNCPNGQYADGPYFTVENGVLHLRARRAGPDGRVRRQSIAFREFAPDKWYDLVFTLHIPKTGEPTYDFSLTDAETGACREEKGLFFIEPTCRRPNWIGFLSQADCETVSFIDDYAYENL